MHALEDPLPSLIDIGLYCGPYPFRRLPAERPEDLRRFMHDARIEAAVVTPFPALFYNRSWDGIQEWLQLFSADPHVRFWAVIDPDYPGWESDLDSSAAAPNVAGIRLFPRYHGYTPFHPGLSDLLAGAAALGLPVNLTARLLDDRLHPRMLRAGSPLDLQETGALLKMHPDVTWVLSAFYTQEIAALLPALRAHPSACLDLGCCKPREFWWEEIATQLPPERLLLGTGAPLYYHAGTRLSLQRSGLSESVLAQIRQENPRRLFFQPGR